jgi:outer membrane protein TolC
VLALAVVLGLPAGAGAADAPPAAPPRQVPSPLKLSEAIAIALQSSNQVGMQQAHLEALRTQRLNAWFNLGPSLAVDGTWAGTSRTDYDVVSEVPTAFGHLRTLEGDTLATPVAAQEVTADRTEKSRFDSYGVSSSVRLFDGLANYNRIAASHHDVHSQEHSVEYTRQQVQEMVIDTYFNLLRAKLLLRVAQESEHVAREQLDRTRALYELGSAARADVLKSQVQLDNTRLTLVKAQQLVRQSQVDLEWAMNLENPTPFEIDTTLLNTPMKTTTFESERDYALIHRENLLSVREGEQAAGRRVWAARGSLLPTLDFRYSLGFDKTTSAYRFGAAKNSSHQWALAANWNLWDRYLNYAQIDQARATRRIAGLERRQAELDAIREVRRLVNSMDEARERLDVSQQTVASAQEDLRLAQERFRVGAGTILDTITAESNLTSARANEVQARVDYLISRASLARATGRPLSEV